MKRIVSKIIVTIILCIIFVVMLPIKEIYATDKIVNIKVTTSTNSVIVNDLIEITVDVSSNIQIMYGSFMLNYDSNMFDFVSVDGATGSGYAGVIPFRLDAQIDFENLGKPTSYQYVVVLKAKNTVDMTDIFVSDVEFTGIDVNVDEYFLKETVSNAEKIKIWAQGSDDATLNSLQVVGTTLTPAFGKWTMAYTAYVGSNTIAVDVAATSSQGGRVEIAGNTTNLAYGNNVVTVTSYAPNGKAMQYTITIVRPEPVTEPPTTIPEPTTLPPEWTEVVVNGISYNINSEYSKNVIPAGFEAVIYDYKDNQVLAATNAKSGLNLFYLVDGMENGKFFIYDADKDTFYDYVQVDSIGNKYIVMPLDKSDIAPPDTTKGKVTINGYETEAYIDDTNKDFAYFYAISPEGTYGWYSYDMVENTIQRYVFTIEEETTTITEETTTEEMTTVENENESSSYDWISENESLKAANDSLKNIRNIAVIVAGVLLVVLIALVVILLANKSEKKHSIGMDNIDYARLEDEEDAEEDAEDEEDTDEEDSDEGEAESNNESEDVSTASDEQAASQEMSLLDAAIADGLSRAKEEAAKVVSVDADVLSEASDDLGIAIEEIIMTDEAVQDASEDGESEETVVVSGETQESVQEDEDDEDFL